MRDLGVSLLDDSFGLPLDRPFPTSQALRAGLTRRELAALVDARLVRRLLRGVFVAMQVPDGIELRCRALQLVVPEGAVVTDTTAGWLHGAAMVLTPGAQTEVPPVSFFHRTPGNRSRWTCCDGGERRLADSDVTEIGGIAVTTPLRTALDLGRLLPRRRAFGALDSMLRLQAFGHEHLLEQVERFKGYRGVRQLRTLAPLADARAQSPGESALRLAWLDSPILPRPELQVPVPGPAGSTYFLDLGVPELRFGAEYDGAEWHGPERVAHDMARRTWITGHQGWRVAVFRREDVFGQRADADLILQAAVRRAREAIGWVRNVS